MTTDNEYFLELEKNASEIVEELNKLRDEASKYSNSSKALVESVDMIGKLTEGLGKASAELSTLAECIREQGFSALTNSLEEIKANSQLNYQKLNRLMLGGIMAVTIIQVIVLAAIIL